MRGDKGVRDNKVHACPLPLERLPAALRGINAGALSSPLYRALPVFPRGPQVVGRFEYLMRGMRLIWPHLPLFAHALGCLLAQTVASLFLPALQVPCACGTCTSISIIMRIGIYTSAQSAHAQGRRMLLQQGLCAAR